MQSNKIMKTKVCACRIASSSRSKQSLDVEYTVLEKKSRIVLCIWCINFISL